MGNAGNFSESGGELIAASKVNGTEVYNKAGEKLGHVHDLVFSKASGKAEYAIMSFGGFLGIGEGYHPLPWDQLTYDPAIGGYVVDIDVDRLGGGPVYQQSEISIWDKRRRDDIDHYYGSSTQDPLGSDSDLGESAALER